MHRALTAVPIISQKACEFDGKRVGPLPVGAGTTVAFLSEPVKALMGAFAVRLSHLFRCNSSARVLKP